MAIRRIRAIALPSPSLYRQLSDSPKERVGRLQATQIFDLCSVITCPTAKERMSDGFRRCKRLEYAANYT